MKSKNEINSVGERNGDCGEFEDIRCAAEMHRCVVEKHRCRMSRNRKRVLALMLALLMIAAGAVGIVYGKTAAAQSAKVVFAYITNDKGEEILAKAIPIETMQGLAHGKTSTENYSISCTDNLPTTCYAEAQGITLNEYVEYLKENQSIVNGLTFSGNDRLCFMSDDSNGKYTKAMTAATANEPRKFVNGLYEGWGKFGEDRWESGTDTAVNVYKENAWKAGENMPVILSTYSAAGRTTQSTNSTEKTDNGIKEYVTKNGGVVKGCLSNAGVMNNDSALTLYIPTTKADLMCEGDFKGRTAYDNFKWIYSIRLDMATKPAITSKGNVAEVKADFQKSADSKTLTVTLSCATSGAEIYYDDGTAVDASGNKLNNSAQTKYTGPFTVNIENRDLSTNPVVIHTHAVKEGWTDAGDQKISYYQSAPDLKTSQVFAGEENVRIEAGEDVTDEAWSAWKAKVTGIDIKLTTDSTYTSLTDDQYSFDGTKKLITVNKDAISTPGTYNVRIKAVDYKDAVINVTAVGRAPNITAQDCYDWGEIVTLTVDSLENTYQSGITMSCRADGSTQSYPILKGNLDLTETGKISIKKEYFESSSCRMKTSGNYILTLANTKYDPNPKTVLVTLVDRAAINSTIQLIDDIGSVTLNSSSAIKKARAAYEALTAKEKTLITNMETLKSAESTLDTLEKAAIQKATKELSKQSGLKISSSTYSTAKLTWSRKSAASGYEVYRKTGKSGTYKRVATFIKNTTVSYTSKSLVTGTTYYFKVRAYKSINDKKAYSAYSDIKSVKPSLKKTTLKLTAGSKKITARWGKVSGASGYEVYRAVKRAGKYGKTATIKKATVTKYVNVGLKKGKIYYYKVRAYRTVSGKKVYAGFSNIKYARVR